MTLTRAQQFGLLATYTVLCFALQLDGWIDMGNDGIDGPFPFFLILGYPVWLVANVYLGMTLKLWALLLAPACLIAASVGFDLLSGDVIPIVDPHAGEDESFAAQLTSVPWDYDARFAWTSLAGGVVAGIAVRTILVWRQGRRDEMGAGR